MTDHTALIEALERAEGRCSRCVGFGTIAYFGDANVTCPDCYGTGRKAGAK